MDILDLPHGTSDHLLALNFKIERAKKHILDFEEEWTAFSNSGGYRLSYNDDLNKRERSYYVAEAKEIPVAIPLIIGDVLHNLRGALDHIAHYLAVVGTGLSGPFSHIYFPIFETAAKYKAGLPGKVKGMRQDAIDAINAIQPYEGGAGKILWHLHRLNNIDKHRLILTVYSGVFAHSMLKSQRRHFEDIYVGSHPGQIPPDFSNTLLAANRFPINKGDILLTVPECELEQDMKFTLGPAFAEPEVVKGQPVIPTLHDMMNFVRNMILFKFESLGLFK